jgi:hypothetical protein
MRPHVVVCLIRALICPKWWVVRTSQPAALPTQMPPVPLWRLPPCPAGCQAQPRSPHATRCGALRRRSARLPSAEQRPQQQRRGAPCRAQAAAAADDDKDDAYYANWAALPIQPGAVRRTRRIDAGPGFWLFEQTQARCCCYQPHARPGCARAEDWLALHARAGRAGRHRQHAHDGSAHARWVALRLLARGAHARVPAPAARAERARQVHRAAHVGGRAQGARHDRAAARRTVARAWRGRCARALFRVACACRAPRLEPPACVAPRRCSWARLHASSRKPRRVAPVHTRCRCPH